MAGFNEVEIERRQMMWNVARWQTAYLLSPYSKKSIKPTDLVKFDWDPKPMTRNEWIKANKDIVDMCNKLKDGKRN